ncbi:MAG: hypothetical protein HY361_00650, partial [Candidatus Aenigmarchaeota archaeon]|nr:hypothetical protein [Candidatus Aenigmarchaeota archaeon]
LSNRTLYSLISIFILITVAVVVYAVAPSPGHTIAQIEPCTEGKILKVVSGAWSCQDDAQGSGGTSQWTTSADGTDIYYNANAVSGNTVGIGTSTPSQDSGVLLDVNGIILANRFTDKNAVGYWVNPGGISYLNNIYLVGKVYDNSSTGYYVDPASTSILNSLTATTITLGGVARTTWPTSYTAPTISSTFTCTRLKSAGSGTTTCALTGTHDICYLTKADADDGGDDVNGFGCEITGSGSAWNLKARVNGATTVCAARCINFA